MSGISGLQGWMKTAGGQVVKVSAFLASLAAIVPLAVSYYSGEKPALSPGQQAAITRELRQAFGQGKLTDGNLPSLSLELAKRHALGVEQTRELVKDLAPGIRLAGDSLTRGVRLVSSGATEQAQLEFLSATRNDPGDAKSWTNLAASYALQARHGEAREAYDRALALDSTDAVTRYNFGLLLARMGNRQDAIPQLYQALEDLKHQPSKRVLRSQAIHELKTAPDLDALRREPQFSKLLGAE